jgi:hypothetical protein
MRVDVTVDRHADQPSSRTAQVMWAGVEFPTDLQSGSAIS